MFRLAVQMRYSHNQDFLFANLIDHSVREPLQEIPTRVCTQGLPGLWKVTNTFYGNVDFGSQFFSQTRALGIVVAGGFPQVVTRRFEKFDRHD